MSNTKIEIISNCRIIGAPRAFSVSIHDTPPRPIPKRAGIQAFPPTANCLINYTYSKAKISYASLSPGRRSAVASAHAEALESLRQSRSAISTVYQTDADENPDFRSFWPNPANKPKPVQVAGITLSGHTVRGCRKFEILGRQSPSIVRNQAQAHLVITDVDIRV